MINKITKQELEYLVDSGPDDLNKQLALIPTRQMRRHVKDKILEMRSEDGTDFLQGVAYMEIYRTRRGLCGKIHLIWVAPECRSIGFGKCLLSNLEFEANKDEDLAVIISSVKNDNTVGAALFESCKYQSVVGANGRISISKEYV